MFELVEEALDEVAVTVEAAVDAALNLAVAAGRDMGAATDGGDLVEDGAGVVAARSAIRSRPEAMPTINSGTAVLSEAWPGERRMRSGSPSPSTSTWILVLNPPRERPMA